MKKIYTLFAFAALCVSGCTNDITEGGNISSKYNTVTLEALAHTDDDDTRALFDESGKKLVWDLAEGHTEQNISVIELRDDECTNGLSSRVECSNACEGVFNAEKTANTTNSNKAIFDVTLKAQTAGCYSYLAAYPKDALVAFCQDKKAEMTLPDKQTPSVDNLDPKATLLFAVDNNGENGKYEGARPYNLDLKFNHVAGYAKMTIKELPLMKAGAQLPTGFDHASETLVHDEVVDHIVFTADDENTALAGVYSFNYADKTGSATNGVNSITLDVKEFGITADTGDFTVRFAVLPATLTNGFTVKVVTTEGHVYTKSFNNSQNLTFKRARVSSFGLKFNDATAEDAVYLKAYQELYGIPEGGFDKDKKYLIAAHGEKDSYTLRNDVAVNNDITVNGDNETCNADDLETSGFVVITEGEGNNVDRPYMLYKDDAAAAKYLWTLTGSGNMYSVSHENLGWVCPGFVNFSGANLSVKDNGWTTWEIRFGQNDFTFKAVANGNYYVNASTSSSKWVISGSDTSTIDIYEDNGGYYWAPASKEIQVVDKYYRQTARYDNGKFGTSKIIYIGPFDASKTYIITLKDTATNEINIIGNGKNVATFNKFEDYFTWDTDHNAYKVIDDDFYFNISGNGSSAEVKIGNEYLYFNWNGTPEISVTSCKMAFNGAAGSDIPRLKCTTTNTIPKLSNGTWSYVGTLAEGSEVNVYERVE